MSNSIRPASVDDLDRICEIAAAANPLPWTRKAIATEMQKPFSHVWVITDDENDDTLFAFAIFTLVDMQAHLLEIAVDPRLRKHGFGAQILRGIINYTFRQGGTSVYLEVRKSNANAIGFYQHMGFVIVHAKEKYYSDGDDAYSMSFKLKDPPNEELD